MINKKFSLLAKGLLSVHALVTLGYGFSILANPQSTSALMGLTISNADGLAELFVMYIGLSGALSLFMLFGVFAKKWLPTAILVMTLTMSGIIFVRLMSFVLLETGSYTSNALYYDIPITILAWLVYIKLKE